MLLGGLLNYVLLIFQMMFNGRLMTMMVLNLFTKNTEVGNLSVDGYVTIF